MCRTDHCLLQLVEGSSKRGCPLPTEMCFKHGSEESRYRLEPFNKLLLKSRQPDKLSNFMDCGRRRPTSNDLDLFGVDVYSIFIDDASAKSDPRLEVRSFLDTGK